MDSFILGVCGVIMVLMCAFLLYLFGYGVGLWSASCRIDSSQPQCIRAGWNGGTVHVK
jgi:hypothetical protein